MNTENVFNTCYELCVPDCPVKCLKRGFCCCFVYIWCLHIRGEVDVLYLILPLLFIPLLCSSILWFKHFVWKGPKTLMTGRNFRFNLRIVHLVFTEESLSIFGDYSRLLCNRFAIDLLCSVTVMPLVETQRWGVEWECKVTYLHAVYVWISELTIFIV
jgi:hypothetical protein